MKKKITTIIICSALVFSFCTGAYAGGNMQAISAFIMLGMVTQAYAADQVKVQVMDVYQFLSNFHDGLAKAIRIDSSGKWIYGYIDTKGQWRLSGLDTAGNFSEGLAINNTVIGNGVKYAYIDKSGNKAFNIPDGYQHFGGKYTGGENPAMEYIDFNNGRSIISKINEEHTTGAIDNTGKIVIPCEYWGLTCFSKGYSIASKDNKMGLIDRYGSIVVPFVYEYGVVLSDGFAFTKNSDYWDVCNDEYFPYNLDEGNNYDIYDKNAQLILTGCNYPAVMENGIIITSQSAGYSESGLLQAQYQMIDYSGNTIYTPAVGKHISYLGEGLYALSESYFYSQLMDASGKLVSDTHFGIIGMFSGGYAAVKNQNDFEGKWGVIDKTGTLVVPFSYKEISANALDSSYIFDGAAFFYDETLRKHVMITLPGVTGTVTFTAQPSSAKVLVNGKEIAFDAYTIGGSNYFKLRDLAYVLSGDNKGFDVTWNNATKMIELSSGQNYAIVGGELSKSDGTAKNYTANTAKIILDGKELSLTAYNIDGNNYFKLRDMMKIFDISVGWNEDSSTVTVDTARGYSK